MALNPTSNVLAWRVRDGTVRQPGNNDSPRGARAPHLTPETHYRVAIVSSLAGIPSSAWDAVAGRQSLARSHAYLSAVAAATVDDCRFFYVLVYNGAEVLVAHACVYLIETDFAQLLPRPLRRLTAALRRLWPGLLKARIAECAAPLVAGHAISISVGEDRAPLLMLLERSISGIARDERCRLTVIHAFTGAERADFDQLMSQGYQVVRNLPLACLPVRWRSYSDYLASMRARYRTDVARRLRRAASDGQTVERLTQFAAHAERCAEQARVVQASTQGFKRETLAPAYYTAMDRAFGDDSVLLVVRREGRVIAHGMVLMDADTLIATFFGRDAGPPRNEWFQLINEVIRLGIERGVRTINLGRGSYDAKALVGAEIEPLHVYARSTIAPVNWLMRLVPGIVDQKIETPRRIFRDETRPTDGS